VVLPDGDGDGGSGLRANPLPAADIDVIHGHARIGGEAGADAAQVGLVADADHHVRDEGGVVLAGLAGLLARLGTVAEVEQAGFPGGGERDGRIGVVILVHAVGGDAVGGLVAGVLRFGGDDAAKVSGRGSRSSG